MSDPFPLSIDSTDVESWREDGASSPGLSESEEGFSSKDFDFLPDFNVDDRPDCQQRNPFSKADRGCESNVQISDDDELPSEESVDALLAREMAQLSMEQREEINFELHGINSQQEETSISIQKGLAALSQVLVEQEQEAVANPKSPLATSMSAYLMAKVKDREYVEAEQFRLLFLRKTRWNIPEAASEIYKHFTIKLELFRDELLSQDILFSDLGEREQKIVYSGYVLMLAERDRAGRSVVIMSPLALMVAEADLPEADPLEVIESRSRVVWYMSLCFLRDEEVQRNGVVILVYAVGDILSFYKNLGYLRRFKYIREGIPYKVNSVHFCHSNALLKHFVNFVRLVNGSELRARFRIHYSNSLQEIKLALGSYGIPASSLPHILVDEKTGNQRLSVKDHHKWCAQIREQEQAPEDAYVIGVPRRFDVLFGKDKIAKTHTGNYRCVHICQMHLSKYEKASKFEKTEIAERIIGIVHESNGRFLSPTKFGWEEVDDDLARKKIGHFFRRLRSEQGGPRDVHVAEGSDEARKRERE